MAMPVCTNILPEDDFLSSKWSKDAQFRPTNSLLFALIRHEDEGATASSLREALNEIGRIFLCSACAQKRGYDNNVGMFPYLLEHRAHVNTVSTDQVKRIKLREGR
ncbi:hypothetical protein BZM27_54580 [Paraburkholderia steynii]|uniref:Uncharacterized protein n=1 Tax=Paraburkholderia steynii TaxID=1245441 RepID=A0A4V2NFF8_9BURK|nr:hypothetical protein BZM27_54580 [Paraburkholderia steynii]